jgi:flavin-dependent dehydrogenase
MTILSSFETAIIGGGPGGSVAACYLAQQGHSVFLLEKSEFPRFHIGESQIPAMNDVLSKIGLSQTIERAGFVEKWGASFMNAEGDTERYVDFSKAPEVPQPRTYQVSRDRFDQILLKHAVSSGAIVMHNCTARAAEFSSTGVKLSYKTTGGRTETVIASSIIDASGRSGFIAKQFGERRLDPVLKNIAVFRYHSSVPRKTGRRSGDIRIVTCSNNAWFWLIPVSKSLVSVGLVMPRDAYDRTAMKTPDETFDAFVASTPSVKKLLKDSKQITEAKFEADYSYLHSTQVGDRFLLVGDAGGFLDPIFSTGVMLAMQSGLEAAETLNRSLKSGKLDGQTFRSYERRVLRRYKHFRRFAVGFYDPAFRDLFLSPSSRFGIVEAVVSILAGNWQPGLMTRFRVWLFFLLVAIQRIFPLAPRQSR